MPEVRISPDLPEHFARLYDYRTGLFETPLDARGLANADAIFELAVRTYPDTLPSLADLEWDKHHIYWTAERWQEHARSQTTTEDMDTVREFRDGTPQKLYTPRLLHQWIEQSQLPPPIPSIETMHRRNAAWASAALLLKTSAVLDSARLEYQDKRGKPRRLLGFIEGITPLHQRHTEPFIDVVDDEYWLSELHVHLEGWRRIMTERGDLPVSEGLLASPRLSDVRELRRHARMGAMIPDLSVIKVVA